MRGTHRHFLVGDIGGTQTRLRVVAAGGGRVLREWRRPSRDYTSLGAAVSRCLEDLAPASRAAIAGAVLAVAGPVRGGRVRFSNLPWEADEVGLARELALPSVRLVNDLEALALGIDTSSRRGYVPVRRGDPAGERGLVVAVGTGLGVALRRETGGTVEVFASEGGHLDFAPADEDQVRLWRLLYRRHGHVSFERVLSGRGLCALYEAFCRRHGMDVGSAFAGGNDHGPAAVMGRAGRGDPRALDAVATFVRVLGAFAGSAALQWLATGGVYLTGGVASHLRGHFEANGFGDAFAAKGRLSPLLSEVPVWLVDDIDAGLAGACRVAEAADAASAGG